MKKANTVKKDVMEAQKSAECMKKKEAKARRKVNEYWQRLESTNKYRKAIVINTCRNTTDMIADEVLDGILLSLNDRNSKRSASEQKRLLRRIVEKRQAQALHAKIRKNRDRKSSVAVIDNSSRCMQRLHYLQFAC